jgi:hypothetical protein
MAHSSKGSGATTNATKKHARLKALQTEIDAIRQELKISPPHTVLFLSPLNDVDVEVVLVETDGFGGASVSVVEGNYPIDFFVHYEKEFASEDAAVEAAQMISDRHALPAEVLA